MAQPEDPNDRPAEDVILGRPDLGSELSRRTLLRAAAAATAGLVVGGIAGPLWDRESGASDL